MSFQVQLLDGFGNTLFTFDPVATRAEADTLIERAVTRKCGDFGCDVAQRWEDPETGLVVEYSDITVDSDIYRITEAGS